MNVIILLSTLGLLTLFLGFLKSRNIVLTVSFIGLLAALILSFFSWKSPSNYFIEMINFDSYASAFTASLVIFSLLLFPLINKISTDKIDIPKGEIFTLLIFALTGGVIMLSYSNLVMLFIGIEILSICLYILSGSKRSDLYSNEAALKYFLMGAFATGFLLFGMALIYGASGSFELKGISNFIASSAVTLQSDIILHTGVLLLLVGLAFKISAVPFHFWTPDVYYGAPTIITAFMATVVKTAAIAAFLRIFYSCFLSISEVWVYTLSAIAVLTMTVGNLTAVFQNNVKRMLAYSSIAHAGYMLIAIITLSNDTDNSILFYTLAYSISSITSFIILILIQSSTNNESIDSFNGLSKTNPFLAFTMLISMLSLAGIPPLSGFFAKYYIFSTAIQQDYLWILLIAILNSCIGIYYYFRVIIAMYMKSNTSDKKLETPLSYKIVLIITALATILLGLFPDVVIKLL